MISHKHDDMHFSTKFKLNILNIIIFSEHVQVWKKKINSFIHSWEINNVIENAQLCCSYYDQFPSKFLTWWLNVSDMKLAGIKFHTCTEFCSSTLGKLLEVTLFCRHEISCWRENSKSWVITQIIFPRWPIMQIV